MTNLIKYDKDYVISPNGFKNNGVICYFNSMLQALLSCSAFNQIIKKSTINNPVIKILKDLLNKKENESNVDISSYSLVLWNSMTQLLCKNKGVARSEFMQGQQCAGEGFQYLIESMEQDNNIQNLFFHRYRSLVACKICNKFVSNVNCVYNLFEIPCDTKDIGEFIKKNSSDVIDYKCKCGDTDNKKKLNVLTMIPEILVIMSKKYTVNGKIQIITDFPQSIDFMMSGKSVTYNAVAQIEHSGGLNGGHYWAVCKRKDGWYKFNDNSVSSSEFKPTNETYIVFYHIT